MLVRFKQTGQLGNIPDNKFDSKLFEKVEQPKAVSAPAVQQQVQQPTQQSIGGKTLGFLTNLLTPRTKRVGEDIAASAQVPEYVQKLTGAGSAVDLAKQVQQAKQSGNQQLLNQLLAKSKQVSQRPGIQAPQFSTDIGKSYLGRGLGVGAELGTLLTPFLGGKLGAISRLGGPSLKTGLRAGAAAGGILGATEPGETLGQRARGGIGGGILGGVTGGILDKIFGVGKAGEAVRRGVRKPQIQAADVFGAEKEKLISSGLTKMGIKGSASQQRVMLPGKIRELGTKIKSRFTKTNPKVKLVQVTDKIDEAMNSMVNYDPAIPGYENAKNKFMAQILKGQKGESVKSSIIYEAKQNLSSQLKRAFTKVSKGNPLTPQEEVGMQIWGVLDDLLPASIKNISRQQSLLYQAAPGLAKQVGKGGLQIPVLGRVGGEAIQRGRDVLGRGLEATGRAAGRLPSPATLAPMLQNILQGQRDVQPAPDVGVQQEVTTQPAVGAQPAAQPQQGMISEQQYQTLAMMDMVKTGGKNLSKLKTLYEISQLGVEEGTPEQKAGMNLVSNLENMYTTVQAEGLTAQETGLVGRATGAVKGGVAALTQKSPEAAVYLSTRQAFLAKLARAGGEKGTLNEGDIKRMKAALPNFSDTPAVAKGKFKELRSVVGDIFARGTPEQVEEVKNIFSL